MAGLLRKIDGLVSAATSINSIYSTLNSTGLLKGISLNNIDFNNLGSIGNTIQSNLQNVTNGITGDLTSAIDVSDITNLAESITMEDLGLEMPDMSSITSDIEAQMANATNVSGLDIDMSQFDIDMSQLDFDLSSLEHIKFM